MEKDKDKEVSVIFMVRWGSCGYLTWEHLGNTGNNI